MELLFPPVVFSLAVIKPEYTNTSRKGSVV